MLTGLVLKIPWPKEVKFVFLFPICSITSRHTDKGIRKTTQTILREPHAQKHCYRCSHDLIKRITTLLCLLHVSSTTFSVFFSLSVAACVASRVCEAVQASLFLSVFPLKTNSWPRPRVPDDFWQVPTARTVTQTLASKGRHICRQAARRKCFSHETWG